MRLFKGKQYIAVCPSSVGAAASRSPQKMDVSDIMGNVNAPFIYFPCPNYTKYIDHGNYQSDIIYM